MTRDRFRVKAPICWILIFSRHSLHIRNSRMVVWARSYGTPSTIVKRGPQFVQLMNG
jgi:hypothetical protein